MNTRLIVIEKTIAFEEEVSRLLGFLLNIDWKNSKSLGFSSSSLSFSQKITILQDIIKVEVEIEDVEKQKEAILKLRRLAEIRNKFAHVRGIDTFEKFFSTTKIGKEMKKNLKKWYPNDNEITDKEGRFLHYFNKLSGDINSMIWDIVEANGVKKVLEAQSKLSNEAYANAFQQEVLSLPDGEKRNNKIIDEVSKKLKEDDSIRRDIMQKIYNETQ